ncbi:bifunctional adenosylcobinamide kinase/adenosylcobinamide-phosphate guanylyltransferase [Clostridium grantii]|uniref:Adenosylcobinamide kinase n=1 Tax=Clostridium grantii DSM 8605 TaxID=1121316 RepID=A0A1M5WDD6_9CLOT|nr:bifunctional adenosylcobinamide kinase/adenosylcobinamide-phosphate guanylyltransferase [Clostridium grantii]SHH85243.1 adenosylcobinamide kinase /adenosylcobinamide-phosphate guanylyltransferase [Clostridium grantii DSM 8605]
MGKIILVTGGCRSGKSEYAEEILKDKNDVLYIATAKAYDEEMVDRIEKHKLRRNEKWDTYEGFKDLHLVINETEKSYILLDCLTIMMTNLLFLEEQDFDNLSMDSVDKILTNIKKQVEKMISSAIENDKTLVMVTNEVGYGLVPEYKLGRIFRDVAGAINKTVASLSDEVYLTVCGIPMKIK